MDQSVDERAVDPFIVVALLADLLSLVTIRLLFPLPSFAFGMVGTTVGLIAVIRSFDDRRRRLGLAVLAFALGALMLAAIGASVAFG